MITKTAQTYFLGFLAWFLLGLLFGNLNYFLFGVFLFAFFIIGLNLAEPREVAAKRTFSRYTPRVGDEVEISVDVRVEKGTGFVETYDEIPEIFELADGSNVHLLWKPLGRAAQATYTYKVRCTRRGAYEFAPTQVSMINPLRLRKSEAKTFSEPQLLVVRHKPAGVRRVKEVRGVAKTQRTDIDVARIGSQSTDFEELREYHTGDPIKSINWKATARHSSNRGSLSLLVNKYEPEGKKAVYFFLDCATYMQAGSTIENTFESVVKATTGVAKFFIDKGFKIGGQFFNARQDVEIYPDTGERQYFRVAQELARLESGEPRPQAFVQAVEAAKVHLIQQRPVCIVITRPEISFEDTLAGLIALRRHTSTRRVRPILVINPIVYSAVAGTDQYADWTRSMLRAENRSRYHALRRMGITVIDWDPRKEDIGVRLLRQVKTR